MADVGDIRQFFSFHFCSIMKEQANFTIEGKKFFIEKCGDAKVMRNGLPVTDKTELHHTDRSALRSSECVMFGPGHQWSQIESALVSSWPGFCQRKRHPSLTPGASSTFFQTGVRHDGDVRVLPPGGGGGVGAAVRRRDARDGAGGDRSQQRLRHEHRE